MLKYQLDSLDGLEESVAALYEQKGDKFVLKVDGVPQGEDVSGLKAKVDELLAEKKAAAQKAKDAEEAAVKAAEEAARKNGDVEALDKSWQEKFAARETELQGQIDEMSGAISNMTVKADAIRLANELAVSGSADILIPHIESRLASEQRDGQYVTVVRDAQGKPSAASLDEFKQELKNNPAFAPVIVGSNASGGGAGGQNNGGAGVKFSEMNEKQRAELYQKDREEYRRLRDANQ